MTEDEMVGQHHQLNGHEFVQTPGDSEGQGSLACYSSWGCKDVDLKAEQHNSNYPLSSLDPTSVLSPELQGSAILGFGSLSPLNSQDKCQQY